MYVQGASTRQCRYSPPPGMLPSCDYGSPRATASNVDHPQSVSASSRGIGGTFVPVMDKVSLCPVFCALEDTYECYIVLALCCCF